jgi:hypothetical protein
MTTPLIAGPVATKLRQPRFACRKLMPTQAIAASKAATPNAAVRFSGDLMQASRQLLET